MPATAGDRQRLQELLARPISEEVDLRALRIEQRLQRAPALLQERAMGSYLEFIRRWPRKTACSWGSFTPARWAFWPSLTAGANGPRQTLGLHLPPPPGRSREREHGPCRPAGDGAAPQVVDASLLGAGKFSLFICSICVGHYANSIPILPSAILEGDLGAPSTPFWSPIWPIPRLFAGPGWDDLRNLK